MTDPQYTAKITDDGLKVTSTDWQPIIKCMADIEPKTVSWLWPQRIPSGRITVVAGPPGLGKSFVTCDLTSRITTGENFPDGTKAELGSVLLIACEDDPADTIRPRLDAHGADPTKVHLLSGVELRNSDGEQEREILFTLENVKALEATLSQIRDCRLVVIDPIGSYLGAGTKSNADNEVRAILAPLAKLAEAFNVAILIVAHTRKAEARRADDMVMGSRAFTGVARAVWHLIEDPDDDQRKLLVPGKCNITARQTGLAFKITGDPPTIQWEEAPVTLSADDVLAASANSEGQSALEEAINWLECQLNAGPKPKAEITKNAKADSISNATLRRASEKLNVIKKPGGFGEPWSWELPPELFNHGPDCSELLNVQPLNNTGETDSSLSNTDEIVEVTL